MTGYVSLVGHPHTYAVIPADTNETTLFTSTDDNTVLVEFWISNNSGSTRSATIKWGNGVTDYPIISAFSMSGNTYIHEDVVIPLRRNHTIKVTSSAANNITFTITVVEGGSAFGGRALGGGR